MRNALAATAGTGVAILLIAGGTGYSYARALLQYLMDTEMNQIGRASCRERVSSPV